MYVLEYNKFPEFIQVGEYQVPLPEPPDKNKILNYNLPISKQKFRRTEYLMPNGKYIEANKINWDVWETLSDKQRHIIEDQEWEKRHGVVWMWIKDMPIPLTGFHQWMLNYWHIMKNMLPEFRENNWCAAWLLEYMVRHPDALGILWLKGRRKTVTTICNAFTFDWVTKYESQFAGLMNKTEKDARKNNLGRINLAMNSMPAFFDPLRRQNWPKQQIEFMPPDERTTARSIRSGVRNTLTTDALFSEIAIGATSTTTFDGGELAIFEADEIGKWKDINPVEMWEVHQMTLLNGGNKSGFGLLFSSVEEITEEQLDRVTELWDAAEPKSGGAYISSNGLARYAEPFDLGYDGKYMGKPCIDEWGFSNHELAFKRRDQMLEPLLKAKKNRAAANLKRKMPKDVSEMLRPSADRCSFNLEYLTEWWDTLRLRNLQDPATAPIRGTFNGHPSTGVVNFIPRPDVDPTDTDHPDAQVYISRMPTEQERNNVIRTPSGNLIPGNRHINSIGVDTFDHQIDPKAYSKQLSDGAFAVKRKLWLPDDNGIFDPFTGMPSIDPTHEHYLGMGMKSNQIVCRYVYRDADPDAFAEKIFQAAVFFGAMVHIESSKPGRIRAYARQHGLEGMLYFPDAVHEAGWSGSDKVQSAYFDLLAIHVENYIRAENDPEVVRALMRMERGQMKKHDLGVAIGLAELGSSIFVPAPRTGVHDGNKLKVWRRKTYSKAR